MNTKTGEKFNEIDLRRVTANETEETGFITCQAGHKCEWILNSTDFISKFNCVLSISDTVVFDNSYSYFKSKKLTYSVVVTTPLEEIEKSANKIEEKIVDQNENDISLEAKVE